MLAHWHGQTMNWSELGRALSVSDQTVRRYVDTLESTFMLRQLLPWHENLAKRQVKAPKVYVADSGILHTLLDIADHRELERHPKVGASWEGFCIDAIARVLGARREESHFWATHGGAELDLLVVRGRQRRAFEIKRTTAPETTASMKIALQDLNLSELVVVHAGERSFPLGRDVSAVSWKELPSLAPLKL
jgi:predicted AAA+ superfamily ATPase